jgi:hypothetical protein
MYLKNVREDIKMRLDSVQTCVNHSGCSPARSCSQQGGKTPLGNTDEVSIGKNKDAKSESIMMSSIRAGAKKGVELSSDPIVRTIGFWTAAGAAACASSFSGSPVELALISTLCFGIPFSIHDKVVSEVMFDSDKTFAQRFFDIMPNVSNIPGAVIGGAIGAVCGLVKTIDNFAEKLISNPLKTAS